MVLPVTIGSLTVGAWVTLLSRGRRLLLSRHPRPTSVSPSVTAVGVGVRRHLGGADVAGTPLSRLPPHTPSAAMAPNEGGRSRLKPSRSARVTPPSAQVVVTPRGKTPWQTWDASTCRSDGDGGSSVSSPSAVAVAASDGSPASDPEDAPRERRHRHSFLRGRSSQPHLRSRHSALSSFPSPPWQATSMQEMPYRRSVAGATSTPVVSSMRLSTPQPSIGRKGRSSAPAGGAGPAPAMGATLPERASLTLTEALADVAAAPEDYAQYAPYLVMTSRFLDEAPSFYPILGLSDPAIATHVGLFARMFHCPQVDMRLPGFLSPAHRRLTFLTASASFGCDYCTAHACVFGDMLKGSLVRQAGGRRFDASASSAVAAAALGAEVPSSGGAHRSSASSTASPARESTPSAPGSSTASMGGLEGFAADDVDDPLPTADRAIVRYVQAAVLRPPVASSSLRYLAAAVVSEVGPCGLEVINAVYAFSGALNTIMDIMGAKIEAAAQRFAVTALPSLVNPELPWMPDAHHFNDSPDALLLLYATDEAPASQQVVSPFHSPSVLPVRGKAVPLRPMQLPRTGSSGPGAWLKRPASNIASLGRTLPAAASGLLMERRLYTGIPSSAAGIRRWVDARLGSKAATFLRRVGGVELARAWCFGLRENLTVAVGEPPGSRLAQPGNRAWSGVERAAFVFAFAVVTGSAALADASVVLGTYVTNQPLAAVRETFEAFGAGGDLGSRGGGRKDMQAGRRLVMASAAGMGNVHGALVEELRSTCTPAAILELGSLLSFSEMWRRMEVVFGEAAEVELGR